MTEKELKQKIVALEQSLSEVNARLKKLEEMEPMLQEIAEYVRIQKTPRYKFAE